MGWQFVLSIFQNVRVGETGGHRGGISVALLPCIWEADLQGAQAVLFLHGASVDTGSLVLLQLLDGDHVAGIVFTAGQLFGILGVLSPA